MPGVHIKQACRFNCVRINEVPLHPVLFNIFLSDPSAEIEAREMQELCLERGRQIREEVEKSFSHPSPSPSSSSPSSLVSAERLLLLEALDMVRREEKTGS